MHFFLGALRVKSKMLIFSYPLVILSRKELKKSCDECGVLCSIFDCPLQFQPQKKSSTTDPDSRKEDNISEIYNRKDSVKSNTENLDSETTQTKAKNGGFGGLQKGFLFGGNTKPKTVETDVGSVKEAQSDKKASTIEEIPFITKRDKDETGELKLPEVQAKISEASEKLLGDKGIMYTWPSLKNSLFSVTPQTYSKCHIPQKKLWPFRKNFFF